MPPLTTCGKSRPWAATAKPTSKFAACHMTYNQESKSRHRTKQPKAYNYTLQAKATKQCDVKGKKIGSIKLYIDCDVRQPASQTM